jgi:spore photoproduct lyase
MKRYFPQRVIIEQDAADFPLTRVLLKRLEGVPHEHIGSFKSHPEAIPGTNWRDAQHTLLLCKNRGRFFEPCPGTKNYLCCGYSILNVSANCPLNCSYCILQSYLNNPCMVVYANTEDMLTELDDMLGHNPERFFRVGTGEFTDSLVLDHLTSLSTTLVPHFTRRENAMLELKTKTDIIENLKGLDHGGRTAVSWSLNAEPVVRSEEPSACSLEARLHAAALCAQWGYAVGFHFDPLMYYPGWEHDYRRVVEKMFQAVDPDRICWISLGCFRYMPGLKQVAMERYPASTIFCQEFIRGLDGKMRYFKPIRIEMYRTMLDWIRHFSRDVSVYLCMESSEVWEKALGFAPASAHDLNMRLARFWTARNEKNQLCG